MTSTKWFLVFINLLFVSLFGYNIISGVKYQSFVVVDKKYGMSVVGNHSVNGMYIKYEGNVNKAPLIKFYENPFYYDEIHIGTSYKLEDNISIVSGFPWVILIIGFIFSNGLTLLFSERNSDGY